MTNPRGQTRIESQRRWRATHPKRKPRSRNKAKAASREVQIKAVNPCYLKEARAMLEGKDTRGKNKCVKLPGD